MKNFGNTIKKLSLLGGFVLLYSGVSTAATSSTAKLDEMVNSNDNAGPAISINNIQRKEWRVGDAVKFHVLSKNDCALQMVHIDANGVASMFDLGEIKANQPTEFPNGSDFMKIKPPLGQDQIYAACSSSPLPQMESLAVAHVDGVVEAENVKQFAEQYVSALSENTGVSKLSFKVKGRDEQLALVSDDIVDFYTSRSRTIKRPKLDLNVNFEFRSAELTSEAKELLDEVGGALNDNKMLGAKFELNGHTDDIGSDDANMSLSSQRAKVVGEYLKGNHRVGAERLIPKGYGESLPKVENIDDESRAENRRVEFVLSRDL